MINVAYGMNEHVKPKKNTTGKHRVTLSLTDPEVERYAKKKAKSEYDGNLSLYVRTLIRKDRELAAK